MPLVAAAQGNTTLFPAACAMDTSMGGGGCRRACLPRNLLQAVCSIAWHIESLHLLLLSLNLLLPERLLLNGYDDECIANAVGVEAHVTEVFKKSQLHTASHLFIQQRN